MQAIIPMLFSLVIVPLIFLMHVGPIFSQGKRSFWALSAVAIAIALTGWAMFYFVELTPENFSDVGAPWSMMFLITLSSIALASIIMGAVRVFRPWALQRWYSWLGYLAVTIAVTAALWFPVGFAGQAAVDKRYSEVYCAKFTLNPSCDDVSSAP